MMPLLGRICPTALFAALFLTATTADARPIALAWDASPDAAVIGYIVYYGTQPGVYPDSQDVGARLSWSIDLPGRQYYFSVLAYDASRRLSPLSLEVGDTPAIGLVNPRDQVSNIETAVTLPLIATGSPPAYAALNLPPGLSVNAATGVIAGIIDPTADETNPYNVTARAFDIDGNVSSVQFVWTVKRNHAPYVTNPGNLSAIAGGIVTRAIGAWDPDGDVLSFSSADLPPGLVLNTVTGIISGTVAFDAAASYSPTITASDGALNSAVTFSWAVAPPGQLAVDQIVSADRFGSVVSTLPFSTLVADETLIAFVTASQPTLTGVQAASSVAGGGLAWTLVTRANAEAGTAEIWKATASGVLSDITISATVDIDGDPLTMTVVTFAGAGGVGASVPASAAGGAPTVSLTTTTAGSFVYGAGNDWDAGVERTPAPDDTIVHEFVTWTQDSFWVQSHVGPIPAAGTVVALTDTAPTTDRWNFAAVEIVPKSVVQTVLATTRSATLMTAKTAVLHGTVTAGAAGAGAHFEYGPTATYGNRTTSSPLGAGPGDTSAVLAGLTCNTLYHFRLVAANASGTAAGDDLIFATLPCPAPTIVTASPWTGATAGAPYTIALSATDGAVPYTWDIVAGAPLPAGLTLARDSGVVSGLPLAAGTFQVSVRATGANGLSSTRIFSLNVSAVADPLRAAQWFLDDRRVEIGAADVRPAWPTTRGSGVVVAIVDDGLQWTHPDLQANYIASLSHDFNDNDNDPSPQTAGTCGTTANCRGTLLAGIVGARGDNGIGGSGVAPLVGLAGLRLTAASATDTTQAAAIAHELQAIDIELNAWGPSDDGQTLAAPGNLTQAALLTGITQGRGGKGRVFVWAAGDGRANGDNCNFDGFANSRYVIAVGATDDAGHQAPYSEPCAALLVSAPSSGAIGVNRAVTTTDLVGASGYDPSDYTNAAGGTSAAAAVVSGVAALMLARNPALTWRDIQHILVRSSRKVDATDPGWSSGPFPHNEKYGFGIVDAMAAVNLAGAWTPVQRETVLPEIVRVVNTNVPDNNPAGISDGIVIDVPNVSVEHVEVELSARHARRGDLDVTLMSPSGTVSHLAAVRVADVGADFANWRFRSVRHWGEHASGQWTLIVSDRASGVTGTFDEWRLRIFGTVTASPPAGGGGGGNDGGGGGGGGVIPEPAPAPHPTPAPTAVPGAPGALRASVFGSTVVLSWNPPAAGGLPSGYVLEAGSIPGASDLLTFATENTTTSFTAPGVQAGRYYVRVRAANAGGAGGPSNEILVIVGSAAPSPGGSPPLAPTVLVATAVGSSVFLTWNAPVVGDRPTFYVVEAGSAAGLNDLAIVSTASGATSFSASGVGPGTYYVRVRSGNPFGVSAPSSIATLVVSGGGPGPCGGVPAAPTGLRSEVNGSTVTLAWTAAAGSPTSYVLEAGSRPGASDVTQTDTGSPSTSLRAAGVGAGTYFVRVRARNACGTSAPSNEVAALVR